MAIEKAIGDGETVITLVGVVDIASATELKACLLEAIGSGTAVRISLQAATSLDVAAVQLLWAARHHAQVCGASFYLEDPIPATISAALAQSGLSAFLASAAAA